MLSCQVAIQQSDFAHKCHCWNRRPVKSQAAWKPVLGRLQLLGALLGSHGIAGGAGDGSGFELPALMRFVGQALGSANAEVAAAPIESWHGCDNSTCM